MSLGQILQEYNREKKERAREDEEKKKIILLRRKKENLEHREKAFLKTINTGEYSRTSDSSMDRTELTLSNIETLFQICKSKQKLESLALMYGITAWKQENRQIHFTFDPYIRGQPKGAYIIRMMPSQGKMNLIGHSLPHAVPVHKLYAKYTEDLSKDSSKTLAKFLDSSFRYLRGFLSRVDQVGELEDYLGTSIEDIQATNHYTTIQIVVSINQSDVEDGDLKVTLALNYEKDGERPIPGSLKVATNVEVDTQELIDQCTPFYTSRLKLALAEAF